MRNSLLQERTGGRRSRVLAAAAVTIAAAAVGVSLVGGGPVDRPDRPGRYLAEQLDALRGANDLVRATRAEVGRDPALYPTAYGRLEAALPTGDRPGRPVPEIRPEALAELARTDRLDSPAWQAHYVCLSLAGSRTADAATVLDLAGLRERAGSEALAYLRAPDKADDPPTSLATRAAFLHTVTCLGRDDEVSRATLDRLAADAARVDQPVPVLYAVEALRDVEVGARATRVLRAAAVLEDADCGDLDPIQRAALTLLSHRLTRQARSCLLPSLNDPDTQTRWVVRRALVLGAADTVASLPVAVGSIRADGLVAKSPAQLGTLTATYNAARALTAGARQEDTPDWLRKRLRRLGSDPGLDPSDRVLLAMTCHRLSLDCGPQAGKGVAEAAELTVPAGLTPENQHGWHGPPWRPVPSSAGAAGAPPSSCPRTRARGSRPVRCTSWRYSPRSAAPPRRSASPRGPTSSARLGRHCAKATC
ncbi:hypothetical protein ACWCQK_07610 [Streptomyces sp. NPDC002306]